MAGELLKWSSKRGIYHMENALDSSGLNNNLTVVGASLVPGWRDNAYSFDKIDDYITANGLITSMAGDTKGTTVGRIYLDADDGAAQMVFSLSNGTTATIHELQIFANWTGTANQLQISMKVGGVQKWIVATPTDSLTPHVGAYVSFVIIYDGTQVSKIYLGGVDQTIDRIDTTDETVWTSDVITAGANRATFGALDRNGVMLVFLGGDEDEFGFFGEPWDEDDVAFYEANGLRGPGSSLKGSMFGLGRLGLRS